MILYQDKRIITHLTNLLKTNQERLNNKTVIDDDIERNVTLYTAAVKIVAERLKHQPKLSLSELCLKVIPFADEFLEKCTIDIWPDPKTSDLYYTPQKITLLRDFSYIYTEKTGGTVIDADGEEVSVTRSESYDCIFDYLHLFPDTVGDVTSLDPVEYFKGQIVPKYYSKYLEWTDNFNKGLTKDRPTEPRKEQQKNFLWDL
jgi:hypothetical protein